MRGKTLELKIDGLPVQVYLPPDHCPGGQYPVAYIGDGGALFEVLGQVAPALETAFAAGTHRPCILVGLHTAARGNDYTPWPAAGFGDGSPDFGGGAAAHLDWVCGRVLPQIEAAFGAPADPGDRCIGGISLSGLLALYAPCVRSEFGALFSISGSNWYEGLPEFLQAHAPLPRPCRAFLSYGRAEGRSRFSMQKDAGACTEEVCAILRTQLGEEGVTLYTDGGKHHNKRVSRFTAALLWFCQNK